MTLWYSMRAMDKYYIYNKLPHVSFPIIFDIHMHIFLFIGTNANSVNKPGIESIVIVKTSVIVICSFFTNTI